MCTARLARVARSSEAGRPSRATRLRLAEVVEERREPHAQRRARVGGRLHDGERVLVDGQVRGSALSWSKPIDGLELGQQRDEHAGVAGEPQRLPRLARRAGASTARPARRRRARRRSARPRRAHGIGLLAHLRAASRRRARASSCETKRSPRTSRSGSSAKLDCETVRSTRRSRSSRPPNGSTSVPSASRRAIALTVKSRRARSSSTVASGRRRSRSRGGRARSRPRAAAARTRSRPAPCAAARRSRGIEAHADRPAGDDELLRPSVRGERGAQAGDVDAGDEEVRVLRVEPEQLVADRAADDVRVEPERADVLLDLPGQRALPKPSRWLRSRRARRTAASRPRPSTRAGGSSPTCLAYTSFIPAKSSRCWRNTVVLTSRSSDEPAASRIARRFANTCSVCSAMPPGTSSFAPGLQPELARDEHEAVRLDRLRVRRALERRRRRLGANDLLAHEASLRRFTVRGRHAWPSAAPTALKIAASTCCGSVPSSSRTCRFSRAASTSSRRKLRRDVGREAADALVGEVDVRHEQRALGALERRRRERLLGRNERPAASAARRRERAPRSRRRARARRPRPPGRRARARPRA